MSENVSKSPLNAAERAIAHKLKEVPRSGIRDFFEIVTSMKDVISLGIGEPDFVSPWHIREHTIYALEHGATSYTSNLGIPKLRKMLAKYIDRVFDLSYNPETEILITVGVSEALDLAVRAITNPGDEIIYHEPCYVSYRPLITLAHGVPVAIETRMEDGFRVTKEALEAAITPKSKAIILNYPNNPTGGYLPAEEARGIAELAIKHDLIVITDEIYAELTYDDTHVSIASFPGMKERTIFLHGFSKAWAMTGFRVGYSCAPPALTDAMMKIHQYTMLCAPVLSQEAAIEALKQPDKDIAVMKTAYQQRRNVVHKAFEEMGIPCRKPEGAFYAFPQISQFGMTSYDFAMKLLADQEVAAVPGTAFGACGEGFIRCSYATSMDQLKIAMERIATFTRGL
ncbi:MAG: aminotransferase [Kiritimatiellia bacterium]|jgi:aminotransferase